MTGYVPSTPAQRRRWQRAAHLAIGDLLDLGVEQDLPPLAWHFSDASYYVVGSVLPAHDASDADADATTHTAWAAWADAVNGRTAHLERTLRAFTTRRTALEEVDLAIVADLRGLCGGQG